MSRFRTNVFRREIAIAVFLVLFGGTVIALSGNIESGVYTDPLGPRAFPFALGAGIAICGLLLGAAALVGWQPQEPGLLSDAAGSPDDLEGGPFSPARLLGAVVATAIYVTAFEPVGYLLATPLYVVAILLIHGGTSWRTLMLAPVVITGVLYATFEFALRIPVPAGILEGFL